MKDDINVVNPAVIWVETEAQDGTYVCVGAVREVVVNQNRSFTKLVDKCGAIEFQPGPVETTIHLKRIVFDGLTITEAFGCGFASLHNQVKPFNFRIREDGGKHELITQYNNCWWQATTRPVKADDFVIVEKATLLCEYVSARRVLRDTVNE